MSRSLSPDPSVLQVRDGHGALGQERHGGVPAGMLTKAALRKPHKTLPRGRRNPFANRFNTLPFRR